jgi:UTP--glucose-1-phosphate uridylyltransferase
MANFTYVRQKGPYGNGTPLLNVRHLIGDEPFIYTFSDDFIVATPSRFQQLIDLYDQYECSILGSIRASSDDDYNRYGFVNGTPLDDGTIDVKTIIEKPGKAAAPSDLATVSGFLLTPDIFTYLDRALEGLGDGNELYYNDALKLMLADNHRVIAAEIKHGRYYDTGNKLEYLKTVVEFALERDDLGPDFRKFLQETLQRS